jgi:hypothetical protein
MDAKRYATKRDIEIIRLTPAWRRASALRSILTPGRSFRLIGTSAVVLERDTRQELRRPQFSRWQAGFPNSRISSFCPTFDQARKPFYSSNREDPN